MASTLNTETVARLWRAGSDDSQQTKKLRQAVDALLTWIKENAPDITLPNGCTLYASGEFVHTALSNPPHGSHGTVFSLVIGREHPIHDLYHFARLVAGGWLEDLCALLGDRAETFGTTAEAIRMFLDQMRTATDMPRTLTMLSPDLTGGNDDIESVAAWILVADSDPARRPWTKKFGARYSIEAYKGLLKYVCHAPLGSPHLYRTGSSAKWGIEILRDALRFHGPDEMLFERFVQYDLVWQVEWIVRLLARTIHNEDDDQLGLQILADEEDVLFPVYAGTVFDATNQLSSKRVRENVKWLRLRRSNKIDPQKVHLGKRCWEFRILNSISHTEHRPVYNGQSDSPRHGSLILFRNNPRQSE